MISLLAGKPNPSTFPLASLSLSLKAGAEGASSDPSIPTTLTVQGADLDAALQYGATAGLPRLNAWLTQFMSRIHGREIVTQGGEKDGKDGLSSWRITLGIGSQDLLTKVSLPI